MSTWQIFSDAGNNFRWEISGKIIHTKHADEPTGAPVQHRLPSMADLLFQGCSELAESNRDADVGEVPMFRTGSGKSVALTQSSMARARSVLGVDDYAISGETKDRNFTSGHSNSLFSTGSGKSVGTSSAGLSRAKALLGFEEDVNLIDFQRFQHQTKSSNDNKQVCRQELSQNREIEGITKSDGITSGAISVSKQALISTASVAESKLKSNANPKSMQFDLPHSAPKPPSVKFHTAGGRSLSVSSEALKLARSLLGDPDIGTLLTGGDVMDLAHVFDDSSYNEDLSSIKKDHSSAPSHLGAARSKNISKPFISPLKSSSEQVQSRFNPVNIISGTNLVEKFDEADDNKVSRVLNNSPTHKFPSNGLCTLGTTLENSLENGVGSSINPLTRSLRAPLLDISNTNGMSYASDKQTNGEKRKLGRRITISPFKRPRSSKFTTPLNNNISFAPSGLSASSSEQSGYRRTISTRYPAKAPRTHIKEYFGVPFMDNGKIEHLTERERRIKSITANKYAFCNESGQNCIGAEAFHHLLIQSGALVQYASKEWVENHYKWIVWKLSCYDRRCTVKSSSKFLTISNVIEELKYRYDREVNHGHRSAIKRILEGDVSPSLMMVLCISAILITSTPNIEVHSAALSGAESSNAAKVELTDGWYSVEAILDRPLTKHLTAGKLFVGQKLRIWGAGLSGWVGPTSPLEVSKAVSLLLHINGTYRAHWADRLGFCNVIGAPLAFRCIKHDGGPIPQTLVGVTRVYPVLFKEKLRNGGFIVRTERMEANMTQLYNERRAVVVEGVISELQKGTKGPHIHNDSDSEEGAKILKLLETAAEPEVLLAEMSPEQLTSFASYQAKLEATRQLDLEKAIKKALYDTGLGDREVSTFMRVRVVGLTSCKGNSPTQEGIITIWNPTEKQQSDVVEGQAYAISGLLPLNYESNMLHLQARGSTTKWQPLTSQEIKHFMPFFSPRTSLLLSNLGEVPLGSEFDIAALVLYVGEVYTAAQHKKQWVFVTDSSVSPLQSEDISKSLLAISFCSPCEDNDLSSPVNSSLVGSIVGFRNLIKRAKDHVNRIWVAEATENTAYSSSFDSSHCSHLRTAAASLQSWTRISSSIIDMLKENVLIVIGKSKG